MTVYLLSPGWKEILSGEKNSIKKYDNQQTLTIQKQHVVGAVNVQCVGFSGI